MINGICVQNIWPNQTWRKSTGLLSICIKYFIPLFIIIFCYVKIIWTLSSSLTISSSNANARNENTHVSRLQLAKRNTAKTLFIVSCCFILCWSPNQIFSFIRALGYFTTTRVPLFYFAYLNCAINPFVYLAFYKDFQIALRKLVSCFKSHDDAESNVTSISKPSESRTESTSFQAMTTGESTVDSPASE